MNTHKTTAAAIIDAADTLNRMEENFSDRKLIGDWLAHYGLEGDLTLDLDYLGSLLEADDLSPEVKAAMLVTDSVLKDVGNISDLVKWIYDQDYRMDNIPMWLTVTYTDNGCEKVDERHELDGYVFGGKYVITPGGLTIMEADEEKDNLASRLFVNN